MLTKIIAQEDDTVEVGGELAVVATPRMPAGRGPGTQRESHAAGESSRHPNTTGPTDVRSACWWRAKPVLMLKARQIGDQDRHSLAEERSGVRFRVDWHSGGVSAGKVDTSAVNKPVL